MQATQTTPAGYGFKKNLERANDAVPVETVAMRYVGLKRVGNTLRGRCPIHYGDNPDAFAIWPEERSWYCFRCNVGGDAVALHYHVSDCTTMTDALLELAHEYGVELWERPKAWLEWQDEKAAIRAIAKKYLARRYQEKLTRLYAPLILVGGESPDEELKALEELATALWPRCLAMAERRVSSDA